MTDVNWLISRPFDVYLRPPTVVMQTNVGRGVVGVDRVRVAGG